MPRKKTNNGVVISYWTGTPDWGQPPSLTFKPDNVWDAPGSDQMALNAAVLGTRQPAEVAALFRRLADLVDRHGVALLVPPDMGWVADDGSMMTELEDGTKVVLSR